MSLSLLSILPRHERRVRVIFSTTLSAGAFSATPYSIISTDSLGADPTVLAGLAVPGSVNAVDLVLDVDLAPGGLYSLTSTAVPSGSGNYSGTDPFRFGTPAQQATNVEPETQDLDSTFYGVDLVWTGTDYGETAGGDLATVNGIENYRGAIERRIFGEPLPWDPTYSARADESVNAAPGSMPGLRGRMLAQAIADDRTKTASCDVTTADDNATFTLLVWPKGGEQPISVDKTVDS